MDWSATVTALRPHIVRIETQGSFGTGFLCLHNNDGSWCGVATAAHVVSLADEWQQPIRLRAMDGTTVMLKSNDRAILIDSNTDSAVIIFQKNNFPLPSPTFPLFPPNVTIPIGSEVGWVGFPAIEPYELCFFAGSVSAHKAARRAYLIDGVAINGVSGGPVVFVQPVTGAQIIGTVTAYFANRSGGESLPGLLSAQDVSHFHTATQHVRSIDQANAQKKEFEKEAAKKASAQQSQSPDAAQPSVPADGPAARR